MNTNKCAEKVIDITKMFEEQGIIYKEISDANLTDISESGLVWKFLSEDFRRENNIN